MPRKTTKKPAAATTTLTPRNLRMGVEWDMAADWAEQTVLASTSEFLRVLIREHGPKVAKRYRRPECD